MPRKTAQDTFFDTITQMRKENIEFTYPEKILFVIGAPASGKTTLSKYFLDEFDYNQILEIRTLCNNVVAKNKGKFEMGQVVADFVRFIFTSKPGTKLVVDDFASVSLGHTLLLIYKAAELIHEQGSKNTPKMQYRFCILTLEESYSVKRQMVRDPQMLPQDAMHHYEKFRKRSAQVINFLYSKFNFSMIDGNLEPDKVQHLAKLECSDDQNGTIKHNSKKKSQQRAYERFRMKQYFPKRKQQSASQMLKAALKYLDLTDNPKKVKQTIVQLFGNDLGRKLKNMNQQNVDTIQKNNTIRVQYHIKGPSAQDFFLFVTQSQCILTDTKGNMREIPLDSYPKTDKILMYGNLFMLRDGSLLFLASDVCSHETKEFNVDRRNNFLLKSVNFLNQNQKIIPIKMNLFNPLKEDLQIENSKVRFNDVVLPVNGLIFVSKKAKFLFTKTDPGYVWTFSDPHVTKLTIFKHFRVEKDAHDAKIEKPSQNSIQE